MAAWWRSASCMRRRRQRRSRAAGLGAIAAVVAATAFADEHKNYFDDPFIQVTRGIADCPAPPGPGMTESEMRTQAHVRSERGLRCYMAGRCRLPNSYMYDKEIIPRVQKSIINDGRFADTSVWAEGQRRWVYLKGCVRSREQSKELEKLVRGIDDVEAVINELAVKR